MRVAQVGAGYFGQFHLDAWRRLDVELVGVAERDAGKVAGVPVFADATEMARALRPDIVDIAAPPAAHLALIEALAPLCPHLICQKPLCRDLAEAERAVAAAAAAGARLIVHENIRNQPWYAEALRLVADGAVGAPFQAGFRLRPGDGRGPEAYLARQPYFQQMKRFLIHETGIHFIDTFRYLLGEVGEVFADLRRLNPVIAGEDAGVVLFRFRGGARGTFDGNRLAEMQAENPRLTLGELWLEGSEARLRLDGDGRLWLKPNGGPEREHAYAWEDRGFGGDCVHAFNRHALAHFLGGAPAETEVRDYLRNIEIEEAVYRSAEKGCWIAV